MLALFYQRKSSRYLHSGMCPLAAMTVCFDRSEIIFIELNREDVVHSSW